MAAVFDFLVLMRRYAVMLTVLSANAVILCQVERFSCLFCDAAGTAYYYGARVLSICLGCFLPLLLGNLIMPW
jgi:hypothetical protein